MPRTFGPRRQPDRRGAAHRLRDKRRAGTDADPQAVRLEACKILGIRTQFATTGKAKAKIAGRTFAPLSCMVYDRPRFASAHEGHAPGASPAVDRIPVSIEQLRAIHKHEALLRLRAGAPFRRRAGGL